MRHMNYLSLGAIISTILVLSDLDARHLTMAPQADPLNFYTGIFEDIHLPQLGNWSMTTALKGEYRRNFRGERIADYLFGTALLANPMSGSSCTANRNACNNKKLLIQGSLVPDRNNNALLAEYFGLPTDFSSEITFSPRIEQAIIDFSAWWEFGGCAHNYWAFIRAPLVWEKTCLNATENIVSPGNLGYDAGYFSPAAVPRNALLNSFGEFTSGDTPSLGIGITFDPLLYNKFSTNVTPASNSHCCSSPSDSSVCPQDTRIGDLHLGIGCDFMQDPDYRYHAGIGLLIVAPTGTHVKSDQLLAPQIGNNHHLELGVMMTAHYLLWQSCDYNRYLNFHVEAQVSHLFSSCQQHTFDICNPNANCPTTDMSQYMLAMQFGPNPPDPNTPRTRRGSTTPAPSPWTVNVVVPTTDAEGVFNAHYSPVANLTTGMINVSVKAHGYLLAVFNYHRANTNIEFGYQLYARSKEQYDAQPASSYFSSTIPGAWALKGDSYVFGFQVTAANGGVTTTTARTLSATQSEACITGGLNFRGIEPSDTAAVNNARTNQNIDNAQFAYVRVGMGQSTLASQPGTNPNNPPLPGDALQQTRTSIQPIFLSDSNVNIANERSDECTNTLFGSVNYHWDCSGCWEPSIGIGARIDFSARRNNCRSGNDCSGSSTSRRAGLTDWGIWLKFAASFA